MRLLWSVLLCALFAVGAILGNVLARQDTRMAMRHWSAPAWLILLVATTVCSVLL